MKIPLRGRITSKFGNRIHPVTGVKVSFHNGVDIAAPVGSQIVAPSNGRITEIWDHPRGGKCLAMVGDNGIRYGFAHLSDNKLKNVGDQVNEGDIICKSGNTGASTGPHLHFTVKVNGQWEDPSKHFNF